MNKESEILNWNDLGSKLKLKYPALTSADLQWRHSNSEDLLEMIAVKLGMSFKELQGIILQLP
ncbi:MAG TPA: hypothetical protein VHI78_07720 [Bacteroidales bacterium]|jgi:hypothetical protein|nr:hypothetical protein [Bacteroidales bacterium]